MKTPEWINEYAQDCRQLLGIGDEWRITITMTDKPNGSEGTGGSVSVDAEYLNAAVELNTSLLDDAGKMHQTITHEMMHIGLGSYRMVIDQLVAQLPDSLRTLAYIMIGQAEEQYIQRTSRALLRTIKPPE